MLVEIGLNWLRVFNQIVANLTHKPWESDHTNFLPSVRKFVHKLAVKNVIRVPWEGLPEDHDELNILLGDNGGVADIAPYQCHVLRMGELHQRGRNKYSHSCHDLLQFLMIF